MCAGNPDCGWLLLAVHLESVLPEWSDEICLDITWFRLSAEAQLRIDWLVGVLLGLSICRLVPFCKGTLLRDNRSGCR